MRTWLGYRLHLVGLWLIAGGDPRRFVCLGRRDWPADETAQWLARALSNDRNPDSFDLVLPDDQFVVLDAEYRRLEADRTQEYPVLPHGGAG